MADSKKINIKQIGSIKNIFPCKFPLTLEDFLVSSVSFVKVVSLGLYSPRQN